MNFGDFSASYTFSDQQLSSIQALEPKNIIPLIVTATPIFDFESWFATIHSDMENAQDLSYRYIPLDRRSYIEKLKNYSGYLETILDELHELIRTFAFLLENYKFVQSKTTGLKNACEDILEQQSQLLQVAQDIKLKLTYFDPLPGITELLQTPGDKLVLDPEFKNCLTQLDESIAFVTENETYKDSLIYKMRYRQCMTRSMTLIKMHFVECVRACNISISDALQGSVNSLF